jgi:hypothetical protein
MLTYQQQSTLTAGMITIIIHRSDALFLRLSNRKLHENFRRAAMLSYTAKKKCLRSAACFPDIHHVHHFGIIELAPVILAVSVSAVNCGRGKWRAGMRAAYFIYLPKSCTYPSIYVFPPNELCKSMIIFQSMNVNFCHN